MWNRFALIFALHVMVLVALAGSALADTTAKRLQPASPIQLPVTATTLTAPDGSALVVPANASAVALNVTAVKPDGSGYVTVYPCDVTRPLASNVNYNAGDIVPNGVIASLGTSGTVCFYSFSTTDLVVDVAGWFEGTVFEGATPQRLVDTRNGTGGQATPLEPAAPLHVKVTNLAATTATGSATTVPALINAVALNVTVVNAEGPGYVTVYPCDVERPLASNLNFVRGQVVANGVVTPVSADGEVCLYSLSGTDVVVDLQGWFSGEGFTGVTPQRLADTRNGTGGRLGQLDSDHQLSIPVRGISVDTNGENQTIPDSATAAMLNVTAVNPEVSGYATVWPCSADRPLASNLNFNAGQVIANNVIAPIGDDGRVCLYTNVPADIVVDISGYFDGTDSNAFVASTPQRLVDTRLSNDLSGLAKPKASLYAFDNLLNPPGIADFQFSVKNFGTGVATPQKYEIYHAAGRLLSPGNDWNRLLTTIEAPSLLPGETFSATRSIRFGDSWVDSSLDKIEIGICNSDICYGKQTIQFSKEEVKKPNLVVNDFHLREEGKTFDGFGIIDADIENIGDYGSTEFGDNLRLYPVVSTDKEISFDDTVLPGRGDFAVPQPGSSISAFVEFEDTSGEFDGYYLGVCVGYLRNESNREDNCSEGRRLSYRPVLALGPIPQNRVVLGAISGGDVNLYRLSDRSSPIREATASDSSTIEGIGYFDFENVSSLDAGWYLIKISGGVDWDINGDGVKDVQGTPVDGAIYALVTLEEIRSGGLNVTALTDIPATLILDNSIEEPDIEAQLDQYATDLLASDVDGDSKIDYHDLSAFRSGRDSAHLKLSESDYYAPYEFLIRNSGRGPTRSDAAAFIVQQSTTQQENSLSIVRDDSNNAVAVKDVKTQPGAVVETSVTKNSSGEEVATSSIKTVAGAATMSFKVDTASDLLGNADKLTDELSVEAEVKNDSVVLTIPKSLMSSWSATAPDVTTSDGDVSIKVIEDDPIVAWTWLIQDRVLQTYNAGLHAARGDAILLSRDYFNDFADSPIDGYFQLQYFADYGHSDESDRRYKLSVQVNEEDLLFSYSFYKQDNLEFAIPGAADQTHGLLIRLGADASNALQWYAVDAETGEYVAGNVAAQDLGYFHFNWTDDDIRNHLGVFRNNANLKVVARLWDVGESATFDEQTISAVQDFTIEYRQPKIKITSHTPGPWVRGQTVKMGYQLVDFGASQPPIAMMLSGDFPSCPTPGGCYSELATGSLTDGQGTIQWVVDTQDRLGFDLTQFTTINGICAAESGYVTGVDPCITRTVGEFPIQIDFDASVGDYPDLVLKDFATDSSSYETNSDISLSVSAVNRGAESSDATILRYFRSVDETNGSSDVEIGAVSLGSLSSGDSSSTSIVITAPGTTGTYYFGACVDPVSSEKATENNCSAAHRITVYSDVISYKVSTTVGTGGTISPLSATVNSGGKASFTLSADTGYSIDSVTGCGGALSDNTYTTGPIELDCTVSASFVADVRNTSGLKIVGMWEINRAVDDPVTASRPLEFETRVDNDSWDPSAPTTMYYYLSTDSSISQEDQLIGSVDIPSLDGSGNFFDIATTAPNSTGTYYYGVCILVDTSDSTLTERCSSGVEIVVVDASGKPDLRIASIEPTHKSFSPDTFISFGVRLVNQGALASEPTHVYLYPGGGHSTNLASDMLLSKDVSGLGGESETYISMSLPARIQSGNYYYYACAGVVPDELSFDNNCSRSSSIEVNGDLSGAPDLMIHFFSVDKVELLPGSTLAMSAIVRNIGKVSTNASTVRFYKSNDATVGNDDSYFDEANILNGTGNSTLDVAESSRLTNATLVVSDTPETFYVFVCAEPVSGEAVTSNNCASSIEVHVVETLPQPSVDSLQGTWREIAVVEECSGTIAPYINGEGDRLDLYSTKQVEMSSCTESGFTSGTQGYICYKRTHLPIGAFLWTYANGILTFEGQGEFASQIEQVDVRMNGSWLEVGYASGCSWSRFEKH